MHGNTTAPDSEQTLIIVTNKNPNPHAVKYIHLTSCLIYVGKEEKTWGNVCKIVTKHPYITNNERSLSIAYIF